MLRNGTLTGLPVPDPGPAEIYTYTYSYWECRAKIHDMKLCPRGISSKTFNRRSTVLCFLNQPRGNTKAQVCLERSWRWWRVMDGRRKRINSKSLHFFLLKKRVQNIHIYIYIYKRIQKWGTVSYVDKPANYGKYFTHHQKVRDTPPTSLTSVQMWPLRFEYWQLGPSCLHLFREQHHARTEPDASRVKLILQLYLRRRWVNVPEWTMPVV